MKNIPQQMNLQDLAEDTEEYKQFVDKFKPKKTTDDCYTPPNIYQTVLDWACKEYDIDPARVVRPFYPGGDYERFPYEEESVVIDNPPFSIIGKICRYYNEREIPFFLFAPYLTNFNTKNTSHIIAACSITYENGAEVGTAFLTNMDDYFIRSVPELTEALKRENAKNLKQIKKQVPKYEYPPEVLTAAAVGYMCIHGIEFKVKKEDCHHIRKMDSQKAASKCIFGGGFLLSERAAAERAAAERWELSQREWEIIKSLGKKETDTSRSFLME